VEKHTAHYKLPMVKELIQQEQFRFTRSALVGGAAMGLDAEVMLSVVRGLLPSDLHKSMTTYADHQVWQDVYHKETPAGNAYIKLTVVDELVIVTFKEKDDEMP